MDTTLKIISNQSLGHLITFHRSMPNQENILLQYIYFCIWIIPSWVWEFLLVFPTYGYVAQKHYQYNIMALGIWGQFCSRKTFPCRLGRSLSGASQFLLYPKFPFYITHYSRNWLIKIPAPRKESFSLPTSPTQPTLPFPVVGRHWLCVSTSSQILTSTDQSTKMTADTNSPLNRISC